MSETDYVLVPSELTDEMTTAFFDARDEYEVMKREKVFPRPTQSSFIYAATIAAAPPAPVANGIILTRR
jgi:hypothetical protein